MKSTFLSITLLVLWNANLFAQSDKEDDAKLAEQLKKATAICLVEITKVTEVDARPYDGNWQAELELKTLRSTGKPPKSIQIIKAYGGAYPPGRRPPKLVKIIPHKLMVKGKKMWLVFHDKKVVRCWAADAKNIPAKVTSIADSSKNQKALKKMLNSANGVALVEITDVSEKDGRPYDANYTVTVRFKALKQRGNIPDSLTMVKAYGGRRRGFPPLPTVLKHDSMKTGEKHWLVFSDQYDAKKFPAGIAAWWPADAKDLPAAVKNFVEKK